MELDAISQPDLEQIERIGKADIVIGILDLEHREDGCTADDPHARCARGIVQAAARDGGLQ